MVGIGHWEMLLIGLCCAAPVLIGAVVALILVMTQRGPRKS